MDPRPLAGAGRHAADEGLLRRHSRWGQGEGAALASQAPLGVPSGELGRSGAGTRPRDVVSASLDERTARVVRAFLEASPSALSVQEKLALDRAAAQLLASGWEIEDLVDAAA